MKNLKGDFSFKEKWSYPEGVYRNQFGQLSCDGICPEEIDKFKDENGKLIEDSLELFYQFVDTSHLFHSIESEAKTYEWAGTNFINVIQISDNKVKGQTETNVGTHSSLIFEIKDNFCTPKIDFRSIRPIGNHTFNCTNGKIKIDKNLWKKGILKAKFSFHFDDSINKDRGMFWKGKIFSKIEKQKYDAQQ